MLTYFEKYKLKLAVQVPREIRDIRLPHNKEGMAINVSWLHSVLPILEHKLYIISETSIHKEVWR